MVSPQPSAPGGTRVPAREDPAAGLDLPQDVRPPALGPLGLLRWAWRLLTSMRTALFLLLLVAVAAVPGSIFPQRNLDPPRVAEYLADHPAAGPWLDRLGFFDVFVSPWFSAIYLLLMVSLVGCVIPRTRLHLQAMRGQPPRVPRRLDRLASHVEEEVAGDVDDVVRRLRAALGRRYRVRADSGVVDGVGLVSAEQGYLRETGNLVFHVALLVLIVALAWGHLVGWKADRIVPVGQSFANSVAGYDTFAPGPWVDPSSLQPFTVRVDRLDVRFESDPGAGNQLGAPRGFTADTTVVPYPGAPAERRALGVNNPLDFGSAQVYLLGNGYAPVITVRDPDGTVLFRQAVPFLPQDGDYTSVGAVKVAAAGPKQLGLVGVFLPTATSDESGLRSSFPGLSNPALVLTAFEGELFPEGRPQSVYSLDTSRMTQLTDESGRPLRLTLTPGGRATLPGGRTVTLDSVDRWAGVSTRYDPARPLALGSALAAALGLVASLLVRRRRVFVRVSSVAADDPARPRCLVQIGALAKGEDPLLDDAMRALLARIAGRGTRDRLGGESTRPDGAT